MSERVCVIAGVGPGNGAAIARRFAAAGYRTALCSRSQEHLEAIAQAIPGARTYVYDVRDAQAVEPVFARIRRELGPVAVLVYNAGSGVFASIDDATLESLEAAWQVNARGLFLAAKAVLPDLRAAGGGSIVVVGATASVRGGAHFAPFASAKAAQRILAQSMARHLGPEGIHVSYLIVDGVVNLPRIRERMPDRPDTFFIEPDDVAEAVHFLAHQPRQGWTFEMDLRPFGERW
jgi:NAD(P)-dependent dehydrogenase (short-subunit alcohol dehydrogenase family)